MFFRRVSVIQAIKFLKGSERAANGTEGVIEKTG